LVGIGAEWRNSCPRVASWRRFVDNPAAGVRPTVSDRQRRPSPRQTLSTILGTKRPGRVMPLRNAPAGQVKPRRPVRAPAPPSPLAIAGGPEVKTGVKHVDRWVAPPPARGRKPRQQSAAAPPPVGGPRRPPRPRHDPHLGRRRHDQQLVRPLQLE